MAGDNKTDKKGFSGLSSMTSDVSHADEPIELTQRVEANDEPIEPAQKAGANSSTPQQPAPPQRETTASQPEQKTTNTPSPSNYRSEILIFLGIIFAIFLFGMIVSNNEQSSYNPPSTSSSYNTQETEPDEPDEPDSATNPDTSEAASAQEYQPHEVMSAIAWKYDFDELLKQAEDGNTVAKSLLCFKYDHLGEHIKAAQCFEEDAEQGSVGAEAIIGVKYLTGEGVPQDYAKAEHWLERAAALGNSLAENSLGDMYHKGLGVPKNDVQAAQWYLKAAEKGYSVAQFNLGIRYVFGTGVKKDVFKAVEWLRKSAEQEHAEAQYHLAMVYYHFPELKQDLSIAFKWVEKSAKQGYALAQFTLGVMYYNGEGTQKDYDEAFKWYQKAAEQGEYAAQFNLGLMYRDGQTIPQDYFKAAEWFRKAADQGVANAQFELGVLYLNGQGVIRDRQKGCGLIRLSAEQGEKGAIEMYNRICDTEQSSYNPPSTSLSYNSLLTEREGKTALFPMDPFVVNLSEPGRYLKVTMQFELAPGVDERVVNEKILILRDIIITLIGNKTYEYVSSTEGKIQLKEDILLRTNRYFINYLGKEVFQTLYFTEYVPA